MQSAPQLPSQVTPQAQALPKKDTAAMMPPPAMPPPKPRVRKLDAPVNPALLGVLDYGDP